MEGQGRSRGRGRVADPTPDNGRKPGNGDNFRRDNNDSVGNSAGGGRSTRPSGPAWGGSGGHSQQQPPSQQPQAEPSNPQRSSPQPGSSKSHPSATQPGPSTPRPSAPQPSQGQGRASVHRNGDGGATQSGMRGVKRNHDGTDAVSRRHSSTDTGRGAVRGRRAIPEFLISKPAGLLSKKGSSGTKVSLTANYFCLKRKPEWNIFQYHIDFEENIELMTARKKIIYELKHMFGGYIFDGAVLSITKRLEKDEMTVTSKKFDGTVVLVKFKYVGTVSMETSNSLQVLNLILRKSLECLKLNLVGRNYYDSAARIVNSNFNSLFELWPGYQTSIRQHEHEILVCAEITHKVMRTQTMLQIMKNCLNGSRNNKNFKDTFLTEVLGQTVLTAYNNKTYRIDDVDFTKSPSDTFILKGKEISFYEYYITKYNIKIQDLKQPLLLSRARARDLRGGENEVMALIPELCRCTGVSDEMRTNMNLMRNVASTIRLDARSRMAALLNFNKRLRHDEMSTDHLNAWNLRLDDKLVEISGRELGTQKIIFGQNKGETTTIDSDPATADWTTSLRYAKLFSIYELKRWYVITPDRHFRDTNKFLEALYTVSRGMSFPISKPTILTIRDDKTPLYNEYIEIASQNDPQLIMLIVPNDKAERYSSIKKKTCITRAIPTQVIRSRTMEPKGGRGPNMSVAAKVAIQLNCKIGGAPWMIELPLTGLMTIGYDVCHDPLDKSKSYGAMVATMDMSEVPAFFSTVKHHPNGEELSNTFMLDVIKALYKFRDRHLKLPAKIVIYRDGVGDGQLHSVNEHEVKVLVQKLEEIYASAGQASNCKVLFCVVSKRINTRIFKGQNNPCPGTVVDDIITLPERFDFYLISQSVRQGTVSPTSYNVLYNTSGLTVDRVQLLTYRMTHLYYNWSGTTRVPAVCQYAHKLAFLSSQYIHGIPSSGLESRLFFL